ncbi:MAG: hypothetical protein KDM91_01640 [Verrucomicrobiae bacterium]|nr:hypothetical protein [Verrucomicrobiae bacterium]MCP5539300.1 hypothetical protein [Akkermansiaceae bacterium]
MSAPNWKQKARYRFDNFMSSGGKSIFITVVAGFLVVYAAIGILRGLIEGSGASAERGEGFFRQIYLTFLQMTDPGNMAQDVDSSPWLKIPAILAGLAGIVLLSLLIGFITTALVKKLEDLRKGHSTVIEDGHSLILGWNEQRVVEILRELILANESEDNPAVVILADFPKEEMDDFLALTLPETLNTRVVTRSGSTSLQANLKVVSVATARSAIVLASATEEASRDAKNRSDAKVIKTILALAASRGADNPLNIVAEIYDKRHHEIVQRNCPHEISVADANDILAKIIVQTSRSVGLSVAYGEILSFDGCEMYFHGADWGGIAFGSLQFHFPDGVPLGLRTATGDLEINPPIDRRLDKGDEVLILAEDDSTIDFVKSPVAAGRELPLRSARLEKHIENELIIGWNRKGHIILEQYADYVLEGSSVHVILHHPTAEERAEIEALNEKLEPLEVTLIDKDPLRLETLIESEPSKRDNIIVLSGGGPDHEETDAEEADARTILILLLLRQIFDEYPDNTVNTRLITEVMDSTNQNIISRAGVKDFIISNRLVSMMIAQMSEEPDIKRVYDDLFEEDGSEIYLKPLSLYLEEIPAEMTFADCMLLAQKRGEVCLGVKVKADEENRERNFGVKLIPEKNTPYSFAPDDCLVVVAEDET